MDYKKPLEIKKIHMGKARFFLDLCDGSERGEYVNQDYILHALGRPHRAINLMYCYYPNDEGWPNRARDAFKGKTVTFQWDYPYDDYFTYGGGLNGDKNAAVFEQMRDIRRHGQDVILTLTIDPKVSEEQLRAVGRDLRPFGQMELRINHEATGNWFSFNKRASYAEIGEFFVKASKIIKEEAPNVKTIICIGGVEDLDKPEMTKEEEFKCTIPEADIWSVDKYLSLHWGWPFDVAEKGGNSFGRYPVSEVYEKTKRSYYRYKELNGGAGKPMVMSEMNADGDVTGPFEQIDMMKEFTDMCKADKEDWFSGFTFYQFRDRGRLGLEIEDPNNKDCGIRQPLMDYYIDLLNDPDFMPKITDVEKIPVGEDGSIEAQSLRFGNSQDVEGISMTFELEKRPTFFEAYFEGECKDYNLMMELNGQWFYKKPGVGCIDFMETFYKNSINSPTKVELRIFAPSATGENDLSLSDGSMNSYSTVKVLPKIRIEYEHVK